MWLVQAHTDNICKHPIITVLRLVLLISVDPQEVSVSVLRMTREDDAVGADVLMVLGNTRSSLLQDTLTQDTDNCPLPANRRLTTDTQGLLSHDRLLKPNNIGDFLRDTTSC